MIRIALQTLQVRLSASQVAYLDGLIRNGVIPDKSAGVRIAVYMMMDQIRSKKDALNTIAKSPR